MNQRILEFIKKHTLMVISTVTSDNLPEAAVVEYGETDDLELIFDTFSTSRKYEKLKQNNKVAIVIGWDENITVQYEGEASQLEGEELTKYQDVYFAKNPRARKWKNKEGIVYFKVIPKWIRYSDLNKHPWEVFEVTF